MESFYKFLYYYLGYSHPVHPTQVEMPIGLVVGGFILALVAFKKPNAGISAKHVILLAFLFIFPTVLGGLFDWWQYFGGAWIYPFKIKMVLGGILFLLLLTALIMGRKRRAISVAMLGIYFLAFVDVIALGYFGGEAVFSQRAPTAPSEYRTGEVTYRYNCSGCHPYGGNQVKPQHPIIGSDNLASPADLTAWIRGPAPPMPAFSSEKLPNAQAEQLFGYMEYFWKEGHGGHGQGKNYGQGQGEEGQGNEEKSGSTGQKAP